MFLAVAAGELFSTDHPPLTERLPVFIRIVVVCRAGLMNGSSPLLSTGDVVVSSLTIPRGHSGTPLLISLWRYSLICFSYS